MKSTQFNEKIDKGENTEQLKRRLDVCIYKHPGDFITFYPAWLIRYLRIAIPAITMIMYAMMITLDHRGFPTEYYGAAEPPVRCGVSHLSGPTEPPRFSG